jgi:hypothetical protein
MTREDIGLVMGCRVLPYLRVLDFAGRGLRSRMELSGSPDQYRLSRRAIDAHLEVSSSTTTRSPAHYSPCHCTPNLAGRLSGCHRRRAIACD